MGLHAKAAAALLEAGPMFAVHRIVAAICIAFALATPVGAQTQTAKITFLLVNDIYHMDEQEMADGRKRGGFARLAAVVRSERAKGHPVIVAHAGDTLSPSLMSGLDRGAHIIALTNLIAPDIFVPGNHEFDFGKDVFLRRMAEAKFPLFAANLRAPTGAPLPNFNDQAIIEFSGLRIGLTGGTADDAPSKSNPGDLRITSTLASMKSQAAMLREQGADLVVAVVHANRRQDLALFETRAFDLILTGDDHDLYIAYDGRHALVESSEDAEFVTAIDVTLTVSMRDGRRDVSWRPQFRIIDTAEVEPDPQVATAVTEFKTQLSKELDVTIATTEVAMDSRTSTVRAQEAAIGNLVADALRDAMQADIALMNGGGIRGGKLYDAGSAVTRRDIYSELVFNNHLVLLQIKGRDLRAALENGLSQLPHPDGRFPHVSGMQVEADLTRTAGRRLVSVRIGGERLRDNKDYRLATNDFLARGGDGYLSLRNAKPLARDYDGPLMAPAVADYLAKSGTLKTGVDGRMTLK